MPTPDDYLATIVGAGTPVFSAQLTDGTCTVVGDLDLWSAPTLEQAVDHAGSPVRVDLGGVTFLDSIGIRVLVRGLQTGRVREYVNPSDAARRVLEVTGLAEALLADAVPPA